jgi:DNA-directed RNA polymerase subunit RPC12/RpoP
MKLCADCKKELTCSKNGVMVLYHGNHAYMGDEFECPVCGTKTVVTNPHPFWTSDELIAAKEADARLIRMRS